MTVPVFSSSQVVERQKVLLSAACRSSSRLGKSPAGFGGRGGQGARRDWPPSADRDSGCLQVSAGHETVPKENETAKGNPTKHAHHPDLTFQTSDAEGHPRATPVQFESPQH